MRGFALVASLSILLSGCAGNTRLMATITNHTDETQAVQLNVTFTPASGSPQDIFSDRRDVAAGASWEQDLGQRPCEDRLTGSLVVRILLVRNQTQVPLRTAWQADGCGPQWYSFQLRPDRIDANAAFVD